ncbi:hypothetical protein [Bdellovibrio sp. HCB-162]|uniref:hypothetical protein n=1 Tax=Bdellovibrio sp. HCB-162 TaxID=3394234 RepID=UPI0039BD63BB
MKFANVLAWILLMASICTAEESVTAWKDPECSFYKKQSNYSARQLISTFLKLDSEGGFVNSAKIEEFALCPGHQGGGDSFEVINGFSIVKENIGKESSEFVVKFQKLGTVTSGGRDGSLNSFIKSQQSDEVLFKLAKTPFGWRIDFKNTHIPKVLRKNAEKVLPHKDWVKGERQLFESER